MDKRNIVQDITSGKSNIAVEVSAQLAQDNGMSVSTNTIPRALKESRLCAAPKVKKTFTFLHYCQACLEFAHCYKDWTVDD